MSSSHIFIWLVISCLLYGLSASNIYSYPSEVKVRVRKDFVYQLNSTKTIKYVKWVLFENEDSKDVNVTFYNGKTQNPVLPAIYKGRLEYFGDWKNGSVWYKLKNVSLSDSGYYGVFVRPVSSGQQLPSSYLKTQLSVTVQPTFTVKPNSITTITEYNDLSIICSATGPPSPTVKWLNVSNAMANITQGSGSAVLNISRITRHYNGQRYKCQANNNPNEPPEETTTQIQVNYAPEIHQKFKEIFHCIGDQVELNCSADGNPNPTITWDNKQAKFIIQKDSEFRNYTCKAKNSIGTAEYVVRLVKTNVTCKPPVVITKPTPQPTDSVHPGIIAGVVVAGLLAIVGLIIAIVFLKRRKLFTKRDKENQSGPSVTMNTLNDNEEFYATAQHPNRNSSQPGPVTYAVVDKSKKKKKPGQMIYADLDHDAPQRERPPSERRMTGGSNNQPTLYADIRGTTQPEEPRYGNMQDLDHM